MTTPTQDLRQIVTHHVMEHTMDPMHFTAARNARLSPPHWSEDDFYTAHSFARLHRAVRLVRQISASLSRRRFGVQSSKSPVAFAHAR